MTTETETVSAPALKTFIDVEQFKKDVAINMLNLSVDLQNHASLYSHYAQNAIRANRQLEVAKKALEIREAQLDREHRKSLRESLDHGSKEKVTEAQVRSAIVLDPRWRAASMRVVDAEEIYSLCQSCEKSFVQRREMLLQIAKDSARESAGPLRVVVNQSAQERLMEAMKTNPQNASAAT